MVYCKKMCWMGIYLSLSRQSSSISGMPFGGWIVVNRIHSYSFPEAVGRNFRQRNVKLFEFGRVTAAAAGLCRCLIWISNELEQSRKQINYIFAKLIINYILKYYNIFKYKNIVNIFLVTISNEQYIACERACFVESMINLKNACCMCKSIYTTNCGILEMLFSLKCLFIVLHNQIEIFKFLWKLILAYIKSK